ncbi:MAG: outer membrane protein transport protein [Gammaproteobacteria bacterium]|nr:outer membrane protein transport protein [Gammaproteobacteria bacterium]
MKRATKNLLAVAVTAAMCAPMAAMATNGYFGHGIGMKSMGMAGAGIAMAQDSLASATNPASAALVGNRIDFGLNLFMPDRESTVSGAGAPGANGTYDGNETAMFPIPEFGYNRDLGNDMAFALTVVGRGGMNTDYDNEFSIFSGGSGEKPGIDLAQLYISPTFAMKLNQDHSVGVTLNAIYQRFKAEGLEGFGIPSSTGYDTSTGFSLGLGWTGKLTPMLTAGVSYTTKADMSEFDDYAGLFAEQGDFDIPATLGLGIAAEVNPDVTVAFDVTKIYYSGVASINNPLVVPPALGTDNGAGFGWEDMTVYKLGVSWKYQSDLVLRAGWNHGEQPIPSSETLFNILAPGVVEDHLTFGATWTLANKSELTLMYMHALENEVKGSGSIPAAFGGGEADIKMSQNAIGIAYGWDL